MIKLKIGITAVAPVRAATAKAASRIAVHALRAVRGGSAPEPLPRRIVGLVGLDREPVRVRREHDRRIERDYKIARIGTGGVEDVGAGQDRGAGIDPAGVVEKDVDRIGHPGATVDAGYFDQVDDPGLSRRDEEVVGGLSIVGIKARLEVLRAGTALARVDKGIIQDGGRGGGAARVAPLLRRGGPPR
jgi:hypothetical protein